MVNQFVLRTSLVKYLADMCTPGVYNNRVLDDTVGLEGFVDGLRISMIQVGVKEALSSASAGS